LPTALQRRAQLQVNPARQVCPMARDIACLAGEGPSRLSHVSWPGCRLDRDSRCTGAGSLPAAIASPSISWLPPLPSCGTATCGRSPLPKPEQAVSCLPQLLKWRPAASCLPQLPKWRQETSCFSCQQSPQRRADRVPRLVPFRTTFARQPPVPLRTPQPPEETRRTSRQGFPGTPQYHCSPGHSFPVKQPCTADA